MTQHFSSDIIQKVAKRAEMSKELCNSIGYDWQNSVIYIDEFQKKYFIEMKRRLEAVGYTINDDEVKSICDTVFVESAWNRYKKIYNFNPTFVRYLATTEAGTIDKSLMEKLPFKDFYISFGGTVLDNGPQDGYTPATGMFVHVYFSKENNYDYINFAMTVIGDNDTSIPLYGGFRNGCSVSNAIDIDTWTNDMKLAIYNNDPIRANKIRKKQENQRPFFAIAMNACQYLCASNAEIKDVKVTKKNRPVVISGGKSKPINVQVSNVGYRLGEKFEQMYRNLETESTRAGIKGIRKRPHVRRAHWHHYWTGPGRTVLTVKWLEPIFVMGDIEEIDAVIHEVGGENNNRFDPE